MKSYGQIGSSNNYQPQVTDIGKIIFVHVILFEQKTIIRADKTCMSPAPYISTVYISRSMIIFQWSGTATNNCK